MQSYKYDTVRVLKERQQLTQRTSLFGSFDAIVADARVSRPVARPIAVDPAPFSFWGERIPIEAGAVGIVEALVLTGRNARGRNLYAVLHSSVDQSLPASSASCLCVTEKKQTIGLTQSWRRVVLGWFVKLQLYGLGWVKLYLVGFFLQTDLKKLRVFLSAYS